MAPPRACATLSKNLVSVRDKLSPDGKLIVSAISAEIDSLRNELKDSFNSELDKFREEFSSLLDNRNHEIEELKVQHAKSQEEVKSLNIKVTKLESVIDEEDAYMRHETLIFSGSILPAFHPSENCPDIVRKIVKEKLHLEQDMDISTAHRLGKKPQSNSPASPDKRSIIVKFCQRDTKKNIYLAARTAKVQNLYVNESLTPTRQKILYALRQIRRAHPNLLTGSSTFDGKVYAYTKPSSTAPSDARNIRHEINSQKRLTSFCTDYIRQPLETFLDSWE